MAQPDTLWHKIMSYNIPVTERKEEKLKTENKDTHQKSVTISSVCLELMREGTFFEAVDDYLDLCHTATEDTPPKARGRPRGRFPNIAGLCRYLGTGLSDINLFKSEHPIEYDRLLAIFEDEALNSEVSPTLLSAYMKKRMLYSAIEGTSLSSEEVKYCFEHDIFADGE